MWTLLLDRSRQLFFLSLALFFLAGAGLVIRLYWVGDPFRYASQRLLDQKGELLLSILSDPRMTKTIKGFTGSPGQSNSAKAAPAGPSPTRYVLDRLLQQDGKLLLQLVDGLLQRSSVQQTLAKLRTSQSGAGALPKVAQQGPQTQAEAVVEIGKFMVQRLLKDEGKILERVVNGFIPVLVVALQREADRLKLRPKGLSAAIGDTVMFLAKGLLKQDAHHLKQVTKVVTKTIYEAGEQIARRTKVMKPGAPPWQAKVSEKLGRYAMQQLLQDNAKSLTLLSKTLFREWQQASKRSQHHPATQKRLLAQTKIQIAALERLGRYAVQELLKARAQPLRAIVAELIGPEFMRLVRGVRRTIEELNTQIRRAPVASMVQGAAYDLGRGALNVFLQQQQRQRQFAERRQRLVERIAPRVWDSVRTKLPCLKPRGTRWMRWDRRALKIDLERRTKRKQCAMQRCSKLQARAFQQLLGALKAASFAVNPADVRLSLRPLCSWDIRDPFAPQPRNTPPNKGSIKATGATPSPKTKKPGEGTRTEVITERKRDD